MKVMVLVKATKDSEAGVMPSEQLLQEMTQYNQQLVDAGIMLTGEGLHPSSQGARVRFAGTRREVIAGPFPNTNDLVAGFWMWRVNSMEEAIEWVKRCPNPHLEDSEIEIRRVFDASDFGEALTPELRRQEASMRAREFGLEPPRYEQGRPLPLAGYQQTYAPEARMQIAAQWERFAPRIGRVPGQVGHVAYGVWWNHQPDGRFDYLSGVEVQDAQNVPEEFASLEIPAQTYAVFTHREHISTITKTIDAICTKWLPDSGLTPVDAPNFERYGEQFDPSTGMGGVEIWIAVGE